MRFGPALISVLPATIFQWGVLFTGQNGRGDRTPLLHLP